MPPLTKRQIEKMIARVARTEARQEYKLLAEETRDPQAKTLYDMGLAGNPMDAGDELIRRRDLPESDGREPTRVRPSIGKWFRGPEPYTNRTEMNMPPPELTPCLYAKILTLHMTNGDAWVLATHGVQWPWYCIAHPCTSAGGGVDTTTAVYLRFPAALSVDIKTKGGPGVCGHGVGDVVGYTPSDDKTVASNSTVMTGDILCHSLRITHHLPIYGPDQVGLGEYNQAKLWFSAAEPDTTLGYVTGWEIVQDAFGRYLRSLAGGAGPGGKGGDASHTHEDAHPTFVSEVDNEAPFAVDCGSDVNVPPSPHTHNIIHPEGDTGVETSLGVTGFPYLPEYLAVNVIRFVGF